MAIAFGQSGFIRSRNRTISPLEFASSQALMKYGVKCPTRFLFKLRGTFMTNASRSLSQRISDFFGVTSAPAAAPKASASAAPKPASVKAKKAAKKAAKKTAAPKKATKKAAPKKAAKKIAKKSAKKASKKK